MRPVFIALAILAPVLFAASPAQADPQTQVIWKLVDKKGKVTYADKAPGKDYPGQVTRIEVDLNANKATLTRVGETAAPTTLPLTAPELKRVRADAELARARENLEAAKKALADGQEPTPEETLRVGKVGGGARPVPTDAYHARIKSLEEAVTAAEAELARARDAARRAAID